MKSVIFSDTHLTTKFHTKQFLFLKKIITSADQVIIAGDFWEGKRITFDEFLNSKWSTLFPLLKNKKTIYIYGNHDPKRKMDERVKLFSNVQADHYQFKQGNTTFIIKHGHQFKIKFYNLTGLAHRYPIFNYFFMHYVHENAEHFLTKLFGRRILQVLFGNENRKIKKWAAKNLRDNEVLICGHTHASEVNLENRFINTGLIRHGIGQYVLIENGKPQLKNEAY